MPKGELHDIKPFSKEVFDKTRAEKGYSLRALAQEADVNLRTLCRAMNSGSIKSENFEKIARFLDIQPSLLSGTYPPLQNGSITLSDLKMSDFPYSEKQLKSNNVEYFVDLLLRVLTLFDVSTDNINGLDTEKKFQMLREMVNSIEKISNKYFPMKEKRYLSADHERFDYSGAELMLDTLDNDEISEYATESESIIREMEDYKKAIYNKEHADTTLRQELLKKKPKGYTKKQIAKMSTEEIENLDRMRIKHYCKKCGACINDQKGFVWNLSEWTCASCGVCSKIK